jgi:peroxiredoxin
MFPQAQQTGRLGPELVPTQLRGQAEFLEEALGEARRSLPLVLAAGDRVFAGTTFFRKDAPVKLALVESANGEAYLFADVNQNNSFETGERFEFGGPNREAVLRLPINVGRYRHYPIRIFFPMASLYKLDARGKSSETTRMLLRSPFVFVEGHVDIAGQKTVVRYAFDLKDGAAYPTYGWQGMDTNGDGTIDERANSDEFTFAKDEGVIFRVNGHDVSTTSLDVNSGTFVVRTHPSGDNKRIALGVGEAVPDFAFEDLDGKEHRYSEFKGKYVLLSFWGTWCGPCLKQLPDLEKAYQQFRPRGLVILGMGDDREVEKARRALSAAGVTFPQSVGDTGNELVYKRFRINRFPTKLLVGPDAKVLAVDSDGSMLPEQLPATLNKLLPAQSNQP